MILLFINHNSDLYGASRSLCRMAARLMADGHTVHVALPETGPLVEKLTLAGAHCHVLPGLAIIDRSSMKSWSGRIRFLKRLLVSPFQLRGLIRRIGPDIVHTNVSVIVASGLATCMTRYPHILHVREFYDEFKTLWPWYRRYLLATTDRVVCVSSSVARQFPPCEKVAVLHNGFPRAEFAAPSRDRIDAFRHHVRAGDDALLVGLPGRIKLKRKGQETFIGAATRLVPLHPRVRFVILGEPFAGNEDHRDALVSMAHDLGLADKVVFAGEWKDMPAAYAALDVVVLASGQAEPFGGVVIEAMAMGKPVVGTDIGGTPEQIEDGVTGFLVSPNDPDAMADRLGRLLREPALRESMGQSARRRYEEHFEFEKFYVKLHDIYRMILSRL